ncbi:hypothetical protein [Pseudomonas nitroreducens]|uniref:hypothetical protein n=1 Tax=Pseudomonas nitroreducens TaxID=46680 RepID=UPI000ADDC8B8|nr:hypothetical protein [Pseudomonas nitroreducens]
MDDEALSPVVSILEKQESRYWWSALRWKVGYRMLLTSSALLSALAAIVAKLSIFEPQLGSDISSILAGCAAVMTTLMAVLNFETNSRLSQRSLHQIQVLLLGAKKSGANPDKLLESAQKVIEAQSREMDKLD